MNKKKKVQPSSLDQSTSNLPKKRKGKVTSRVTHGSSLTNTPAVSTIPKEKIERMFSTEFHGTIVPKVQLTRKQICFLSGLVLFEIREHGLDLNLYLKGLDLYQRLLGSKLKPENIKDQRERNLAYGLHITLASRDPKIDEKEQLPEEIKLFLNQIPWIPKERTFRSWIQTYSWDKYFEISIVPVEHKFERLSNSSERYSSYCKGYGETGPSSHKRKTLPTAELDGEDDIQEEGVIPLLEYTIYLLYVQLLRKYNKGYLLRE